MFEFITPFFLAIVWVTFGCLVIRLLWQTNYDWICIFWLVMVFGFTFFNRIILSKFPWPGNIIVTTMATLGPIIANFSYVAESKAPYEEQRWAALVYGFILMVSSVIFTLKSKIIFDDVVALSANTIGQIGLILIVLLVISLGMVGLRIIFLWRKEENN